MKKGFTLAEVMGIIVIISCIALIIVPVVDKQLKEGKQEMYDNQINSIKSALDIYMNDINLKENDSIQITLYQLKKTSLIDMDIKNPISDELFPNDTLITINNTDGVISYEIDDKVGTNKRGYESIPKMTLNGNVLEYVELGNSYLEKGASAIYNGQPVPITINSNVNSNIVGSYKIIYSVEYMGITNKIIRNVIIKDTTGPTIEFETLNIPLSKAKTYDYESDIIVNDISGIKSINVETNFGSLKGTYSVKYIVTDNYDNVTVKYRKVITS